MRTVIVACLVALAAVVSAQPDCRQLGFGDLGPFAGANLSVCLSTDAQCCTADFLERVEVKVRQRLERYLGEEFKYVINAYHEEIENLIDYFRKNFIECVRVKIPFSNRVDGTSSAIRSVLERLAANIVILADDQFNVRGYIEELLDAVIKGTAGSFGQTELTVQCITDLIKSKVDKNVVDNIESQLQRIRRAITTLRRIDQFLDGQKERLANVTIVKKCVLTFINIAFCSRCTRQTPPMCFRTCNALLRGCYSPYYTVLNEQYLPLWRHVQRIVELTKITVKALLAGESALLDITSATRDVLAKCSVTDNGIRSNDNLDSVCDAIPSSLVDRLSKHNGALEYRREGLIFCIDALHDRLSGDACLVADDVFSEGEEIDTSRCKCTDGLRVTMDDKTDRAFEMNDAENQGENPVFDVSEAELEAELEAAEARISGMGDPVTAFLTSEEFTSVAPEDQEGDSSSAGVVASLSILLLSLLTALI